MTTCDDDGSPTRAPRSFVRRAGRTTASQQRALEEHWPEFGLGGEVPVSASAIFGRQAPLCVEVGFGMGDTLAELASSNPSTDFVGIEVHEPGIGRLLNLAAEQGLSNLRVMRGDAVELLRCGFGPDSLDLVLVYFPDPWPKKRHHKRRLIQAPFVQLLCDRLRPGAKLQLASDWEPYALHMLTVLDAFPQLENLAGAGCFSPRPPTRPQTKFERRGLRLGHTVFDLLYRRTDSVMTAGDQDGRS